MARCSRSGDRSRRLANVVASTRSRWKTRAPLRGPCPIASRQDQPRPPGRQRPCQGERDEPTTLRALNFVRPATDLSRWKRLRTRPREREAEAPMRGSSGFGATRVSTGCLRQVQRKRPGRAGAPNGTAQAGHRRACSVVAPIAPVRAARANRDERARPLRRVRAGRGARPLWAAEAIPGREVPPALSGPGQVRRRRATALAPIPRSTAAAASAGRGGPNQWRPGKKCETPRREDAPRQPCRPARRARSPLVAGGAQARSRMWQPSRRCPSTDLAAWHPWNRLPAVSILGRRSRRSCPSSPPNRTSRRRNRAAPAYRQRRGYRCWRA